MSAPKHCQHGIALMDKDAVCRECELVWYRECLADAERRVISCREQIAIIEALPQEPT